jgi:ATP-binding cassette subfamily C protein
MKRRLPRTILIVVSHRTSVAAIADQCLTIDSDLVATVAGKAGPRSTVSQKQGGRECPHD